MFGIVFAINNILKIITRISGVKGVKIQFPTFPIIYYKINSLFKTC